MVIWSTFLRGLARGVIALLSGLAKGVMARLSGLANGLMNWIGGVLGLEEVLGVLVAATFAASSLSLKDRSGDRDREGEWYCEGGAVMGGVIGVQVPDLGVRGAELISRASVIFSLALFRTGFSRWVN